MLWSGGQFGFLTVSRIVMILIKTLRYLMMMGLIGLLMSCGITKKKSVSYLPPHHHQPQLIQITKVSQTVGAQEVLMQGMSLIGTPYRYGGSSREAGFDCSGMVQYIYKQALQVSLPRTARDIAAVSRKIPLKQLRVGDLVFFNTNGQPYSHMGLYIGGGEFIHAPSSNGVIRTAKLEQDYFKRRFTDARTLFAR